jgi:hypothetical protein
MERSCGLKLLAIDEEFISLLRDIHKKGNLVPAKGFHAEAGVNRGVAAMAIAVVREESAVVHRPCWAELGSTSPVRSGTQYTVGRKTNSLLKKEAVELRFGPLAMDPGFVSRADLNLPSFFEVSS